MIKKSVCIKNYQDRTVSGSTWGVVTGLTDSNVIQHYDKNSVITANLLKIPILLTQNIDNIGFYTPEIIIWNQNTYYYSGETVIYNDFSYNCKAEHTSGLIFDEIYWDLTQISSGNTNTIQFIGESKINEFRRYGKTDSDKDLYNPTWNSGFTQEIYLSNGLAKQITGERVSDSSLSTQNVYDYKIWVSGNTGTTINYSDINKLSSTISFVSSGMTSNNSIATPKMKLDYLIGVINEPKINIDVFIDRGSNSSFERHMKLGDIKSFDDLESYGNGYYKIKED